MPNTAKASENADGYFTSKSSSGIWIADNDPRPFATKLGLTKKSETSGWLDDYTGIWMVLSDYLELNKFGKNRQEQIEKFLNGLLVQTNKADLIHVLAMLNNSHGEKEFEKKLLEYLDIALRPGLSTKIRACLSATGVENRKLLARVTIMRAMRYIAEANWIPETGPSSDQESEFDTNQLLARVIMLVHAIGEITSSESFKSISGQQSFGGTQIETAAFLFCTGAFARVEDEGNLIGRTKLLYEEIHSEVTKYSLPVSMENLLHLALGMPLNDFLYIGFSIWSKTADSSHYTTPMFKFSEVTLPGVSSELIEKFLDKHMQTLEEFRIKCSEFTGDWEMHVITEKPLLRISDFVLILDGDSFIQLFTRGIFWRIHDYIRDHLNDSQRNNWFQFYGEMHEILVKRYAKAMAPSIVGGQTAFFEESELSKSFNQRKVCDCGVDFGNEILLLEAQSGQFKKQVVSTGDLKEFQRDLERMVLIKTIQLDSTVQLLIDEELISKSPLKRTANSIYAFVVVGGQFPHNPAITRYLNDSLQERNLLTQGINRAFAILDYRDLEELDASRIHQGVTAMHIIKEWYSQFEGQDSLSDWIRKRTKEIGTPAARSEIISVKLNSFFEYVDSKIANQPAIPQIDP